MTIKSNVMGTTFKFKANGTNHRPERQYDKRVFLVIQHHGEKMDRFARRCPRLLELKVEKLSIITFRELNMHKVGIIGAGVIADFHAPSFAVHGNTELVAAFARNQGKADSFSQKYGCTGYSDLNAFLAHPEMKIVTIGSVSGVHLEHVSAAAQAGKHIICEKPLEITPERIDKMIEICERNQVMLSESSEKILTIPPEFSKMHSRCTETRKLVLCDTAIKWWRTQEYYDSGAWRGTWDLDGGGALMNQSIHTIDLMLHLMGDVKAVSAPGGLEAHQGIEVEDIAVAIVEFKSGARGVIQASTACYSNSGLPASIHICGDQGSIMMVDDKFSIWDLKHSMPEDDEILRKTWHLRRSFGSRSNRPQSN